MHSSSQVARTALMVTIAVLVGAVTGGCKRTPVGDENGDGGSATGDGGSLPAGQKRVVERYAQTFGQDLDILFVVDNSGSMEHEQRSLNLGYTKLVEALRSPKLANGIPDVHIGVVSTDMGVGKFTSIPSCGRIGGDKGIMHNKPRMAGCSAPTDKYISYVHGKTNVPGCSGDPVECVKDAFSCIVELGTDGCGFEAPLESARQALDPKLKRNPGFLRKDAYLAVIFVTDEDDCSAKNKKLFDPTQKSNSDPLGPLTSFRCFEFGIECDGDHERTDQGARTNCRPAGTYLYPVQEYIDFFYKLKGSRDRVVMAAVAGPPTPVRVGLSSNGQPTLRASCQTPQGFAVPGIRLEAVVDGFRGQFFSICGSSYGPPLKQIGERILAALGGQCIGSPLLLESGGLACRKGISLGAGKTCSASCLDRVDCQVEQGVRGSTKRAVHECPSKLFDPAISDCGSTCPCWRVVPRPDVCGAQVGTTPFGLEILRKGDPPAGTVAVARCRASTHAWGSKEVAALPQCR